MKKQFLLMTLLTVLMFTACQEKSEISPVNQKATELEAQLTEQGVAADMIEQVILSVENNEVKKSENALTPDEIAKMIESENASSKSSSCTGLAGISTHSGTLLQFAGINSTSSYRIFNVEITRGSSSFNKYYLVGPNDYFYDTSPLDCGDWTVTVTAFGCTDILSEYSVYIPPPCF